MSESTVPEEDPDVPDQDLDWVAQRSETLPPSLRQARIGWPSIILLLLAVGGAGLGAASVGGWFGFALIVVLVVVMLGLLYVWSDIKPDPEPATPDPEPADV